MKTLIALGINILIVAGGVSLYFWLKERRALTTAAS